MQMHITNDTRCYKAVSNIQDACISGQLSFQLYSIQPSKEKEKTCDKIRCSEYPGAPLALSCHVEERQRYQ